MDKFKELIYEEKMEIDGREPATLIILGVVATVVTFAGAAIYIYKTGKRYLKVIRMD